MKILIVGTGCIGQLYGHFLKQGGATVDACVRPRYADETREGFRLYDRDRGFDDAEEFTPDAVKPGPESVDGQDYDAALLCIPSTGLRSPWLRKFAAAIGTTPVISLTPGLRDREKIAQHIPDDQIGVGLITAVAYPAPLPGEDVDEPGTAYWLPPMAPAFFEGPGDIVEPVTNCLDKGGMKTRRVDDVTEKSAFGAAVLIPAVATLETLDWSLERLRSSRDERKLLKRAIDEAASAVENYLDTSRPLPLRFVGPSVLRGVLTAAPMMPPFDLETYLRVHFTKVGGQTRMALDEFIDRRRLDDLESPALKQLRETIGDVE